MTTTTEPVPTRRPRVLLIDDHDLVRIGLRTALDTCLATPVQWSEASSLSDGLTLYGQQQPVDLVLLDLNLADCKGLQGLRQFLQSFPQARIAVLSGTQDEFVVGQAKAMGAVAYLPKSQSPQDTCTAISKLLFPDPPAATNSMAPMGTPAVTGPLRYPSAATYDRVAELGPRHLEILELVLSGCSNQEISNATKLSLGTVKNYVSTILLALDVKSRSHLISLFR